MLNVTEQSLSITSRFFEVLDILRQQKKIRGLQTFTRNHGLNYGNMNTLKNNPHRCGLKPEYIAFLIEDYNVNAEFILLGKGEMFKD